MNTATTITNTFVDIDETILHEILSYFTLIELNASIRKVSKSFHNMSQQVKEFHFDSLSRIHSIVQIIGLPQQHLSMRGVSDCQHPSQWVELSGLSKIGSIIHPKENPTDQSKESEEEEQEEEEGTFFPIQLIDEITGEERNILVKAYHLNIYPSKSLVLQREKSLNATSYSNNGTIRLPHEMLLKHCLLLSRWHCNLISGYSYFPNDYTSFERIQTNNHPDLVRVSSTMYSLWGVKPRLMGQHGEFSILDLNVMSLVKSNDYIIQHVGRKSNWKVDGLNGEFIVRNYIRFMQSWDTERINGMFWITGISYNTGTVIVKVNDDTNDLDLGHVYLVKGNISHESQNLPNSRSSSTNLPYLCHATILPLYDFLVYDEVCCINILPQVRNIGERTKSILKNHVQIALNQRKIITKGQSSARGLWDSEPPQLPILTVNDDEQLYWSGSNIDPLPLFGNDAIDEQISHEKIITEEDKMKTFNITKKQKNIALKIAKVIKKKGVLNGSYSTEIYNILLFRRFGYTREENPERLCAILINNQTTNIFTFKDELSYDLNEILHELFIHVKQHHGAPPMIMLDDSTAIKPLQQVLNYSLKVIGINDHIQVNWYPPPSKEETYFISTISDRIV